MNPTELCEDLKAALGNLNSAIERIASGETELYSSDQVAEIKTLLFSLFWKALPHFVNGKGQNPIHHNTKVLDNMVQIGLGEKLEYREFKNAVILALLHDIGNAISQRQKVKTDEVQHAMRTVGVDAAKPLAMKAISFRLEHMDNGPGLAREVLKFYVNDDMIGNEDLHFICRAITVHDYPSIEKVLRDIDPKGKKIGYRRGDFLLPFEATPFGRLITWLREADRLYMVSEQGVIKDLRDAKIKPTPKKILNKLKSNANKHADEFKLYRRAGKAAGFKGRTLYRTRTGYDLFKNFQKSLQQKYRNSK